MIYRLTQEQDILISFRHKKHHRSDQPKNPHPRQILTQEQEKATPTSPPTLPIPTDTHYNKLNIKTTTLTAITFIVFTKAKYRQ